MTEISGAVFHGGGPGLGSGKPPRFRQTGSLGTPIVTPFLTFTPSNAAWIVTRITAHAELTDNSVVRAFVFVYGGTFSVSSPPWAYLADNSTNIVGGDVAEYPQGLYVPTDSSLYVLFTGQTNLLPITANVEGILQ